MMLAALFVLGGLHGGVHTVHPVPDDSGGTLERCTPGSDELAAARKAFDALDGRMASLEPGDSPVPVRKALRAVLDHRCFALHVESSRVPSGAEASSLVLRAWWDAGGRTWLESFVEGPDPGAGAREIVLPPDVPRELTLDSAPSHPLAALLCHASDEACGAATEPWIARAEAFFRGRALDDGTAKPRESGRDGERTWSDRCLDGLEKEEPPQRYEKWHACVDEHRDRACVFPLGGFRVPDSGWLVLRGRRGHYQFCDELRAYDLATGSAWIAQSCSGLALRNDGSVDGAATDMARKPRVTLGTVDLAAIREAAFLILFAKEIGEPQQRYSERAVLPPGVVQVLPAYEGLSSIGMAGFWASSAQTQIGWTWIVSGKPAASGTFTWPDSSDAPEDWIDLTLPVAEATLVPGCPAAALPPALGPAPAVSGIDAPHGVGVVQDFLADALRAARCEKP